MVTPSRVVTLRITHADSTVDPLVEGGVVQGSLARTFVLATNSFLLIDGDGYDLADPSADPRVVRLD